MAWGVSISNPKPAALLALEREAVKMAPFVPPPPAAKPAAVIAPKPSAPVLVGAKPTAAPVPAAKPSAPVLSAVPGKPPTPAPSSSRLTLLHWAALAVLAFVLWKRYA